MHAEPWPERFVVTDEKMAHLLARGGETLRYLAPFLGREASTTSAALEAGVKVNVMAYWVKRFVAAGVLVATRVQSRRGSAMRFYRALADEILVPTSLIDGASDAALLQQLHATNYDDFSHHVAKKRRALSAEWDVRYFRTDDTQGWSVRPREEIAASALRQKYVHDWLYLALDARKARELREEVVALLEKYREHAVPADGQKQFVLHVGLVQRNT